MSAIDRRTVRERAVITIAIAGMSIGTGFLTGLGGTNEGRALASFTTLSLLLCIAAWRKIKPGELGIARKGVLPALPLVAALIAVGLLAGLRRDGPDRPAVWGMVLVCCLVGLTEELLWRGYLQTAAAQSFGYLHGLVLTSALFGAMHLPKNIIIHHDQGAGLLLQTAIQFALGLVFGHCYRKAGSIWAPAALHALVNSSGLFSLQP